jgi:hypothetical protein
MTDFVLLYAGHHYPLWVKIIFYPIGAFALIVLVSDPVVQFIRKVRINRKRNKRK